MKNNISRFFIRISAFLFKEFLEVWRQPMLMATLVIGPFLIMFFFGIGFRNEPRTLRTLFVIENDTQLAQKVEEYATTLGGQLVYEGITDSLEEAQQRLRRGEIDLIAVLPSDPYNTIRNNQQAVFNLYHHEIDPMQSGYVDVFGRVYVDEVNRRVLRSVTSTGQLNVEETDEKLGQVRQSINTLRVALQDCTDALTELGSEFEETCNRETLDRYIQDLDQGIDEVQQEFGNDYNLSEATQQWLKGDLEDVDNPVVENKTGEEIRPRLDSMIENVNEMDIQEAGDRADTYLAQLEILTEIETDLAAIQDKLAEFVTINPAIIVSPFRSQTHNIATILTNVTSYYAPAVIILLLQHLTVTFAALSLVRERQLGSIELFTVAPISALETLLGKYISYLVFGAVLAAVLLALIILGMSVPMLGSWVGIALTILGVIFASLGIGFVISLISKTDTQAVQYSMLVLLTSVFFSGFILELYTLLSSVRIISWFLPATYGILFLRTIMLRGDTPDPTHYLLLIGFGSVLFLLAWVLLKRSMEQV